MKRMHSNDSNASTIPTFSSHSMLGIKRFLNCNYNVFGVNIGFGRLAAHI